MPRDVGDSQRFNKKGPGEKGGMIRLGREGLDEMLWGCRRHDAGVEKICGIRMCKRKTKRWLAVYRGVGGVALGKKAALKYKQKGGLKSGRNLKASRL